MHARFPGRCSCGARFLRGEVVTYNAATKSIVACPKCNAALKTPSIKEYHAATEINYISHNGPRTVGAMVWMKHPDGDLRRCKIVETHNNPPASDFWGSLHNRVLIRCVDTGWSVNTPEIHLMPA